MLNKMCVPGKCMCCMCACQENACCMCVRKNACFALVGAYKVQRKLRARNPFRTTKYTGTCEYTAIDVLPGTSYIFAFQTYY